MCHFSPCVFSLKKDEPTTLMKYSKVRTAKFYIKWPGIAIILIAL